MNEELAFYQSHSPLSHPGEREYLFANAPREYSELRRWVQNCQFHEAYAADAEVRPAQEALTPPEGSDAAVRFMAQMLERIERRDNSPLSEERPKERCFIGTCRDYALLACALLRSQGRPARVRCGFAFYFKAESRFGDDHWVTEVWDEPSNAWRLIDTEVDFRLKQHQSISIDPLNIPRSDYQVAGTAWQQMRRGDIDAEGYGVEIIGISGEWFMASNVIRDLAALNKVELLPFDYWGLTAEIAFNRSVTESQRTLIDQIAAITSDEGFDFAKVRAVYLESPLIRVSDPVKSWPKGVEIDSYLTNRLWN